jgi:hypothetical protein
MISPQHSHIVPIYLLQYRESGDMTVELIDTESGESRCSDGEEGGGADNTDAFMERFLAPPGSLSLETRRRLEQKPVFLCRSVHSYRRSVRHRIVPRPVVENRWVFFNYNPKHF